MTKKTNKASNDKVHSCCSNCVNLIGDNSLGWYCSLYDDQFEGKVNHPHDDICEDWVKKGKND
jgi:hypothetical protein